MCGFVAILSYSGAPDQRALQAASDAISHRGPDDAGIVARGSVALAFRRLAILDLSPSGHQPMVDPADRFSIVFNGEIYNFIELRAELEQFGHTFRSTGDTEVLLRAFQQWGPQCVERLRGMFAFCVHDHHDGSLFVARDRFGIKPLYFHDSGREIVLASELKAIRASGLWREGTDLGYFASVLSYGRPDVTPDSERTALRGVRQIPPSGCMRISADGRTRQWRYWDPVRAMTGQSDARIASYRDVFDEAMRLHLRADVPVGVMLSGGMDSTAIACTMASLTRQRETVDFKLHAFSYESADFDEQDQLRDTIQQIGAERHRLTDQDAMTIWDSLRECLWFHDELVHSPTVLVGYRLYRLAADRGIRVVLNGQGADETLGGYSYFVEHALLDRYLASDRDDWDSELQAGATMLGVDRVHLLKRLGVLRRANVLNAIPGHRRLSLGRRFRESQSRSGLSRDFSSTARMVVTKGGERFNDAIRRAMTDSPLPQYLRVEDRNSMAHSIESRVPFLDHVLVEHTLGLSSAARMSAGWNKRILREAMDGRIPESVRTRRAKFGFPTSARAWFAGAWSGPMRDALAGSAVQRSGWFDLSVVQRALNEHVAGTADNTNLLFAFAQANAWLELDSTQWARP